MLFMVKGFIRFKLKYRTRGGCVDRRILEKRNAVLGKEFDTNTCGKCVVIEYNRKRDVLVRFLEPHCIVRCCIGNLERGGVFNPMFPSFYGKGYIGVGEYSSRDKAAFTLWCGILQRIYDEKTFEKNLAYRGVTLQEDWLNFQNFAAWCYNQPFFNTKDRKGKVYHMDKDILVKGNKTYSSDVCCFVPQEINTLLTLRSKHRGSYPIGVSLLKRSGKFLAKVNYYGNPIRLGVYDTPEEAFQAYKHAKETYIKEVAEKWKGKIDDRVYEALMNWEILIDD